MNKHRGSSFHKMLMIDLEDPEIASEFLKDMCRDLSESSDEEILYAARLVTRAQQIRKNREAIANAKKQSDETPRSDI